MKLDTSYMASPQQISVRHRRGLCHELELPDLSQRRLSLCAQEVQRIPLILPSVKRNWGPTATFLMLRDSHPGVQVSPELNVSTLSNRHPTNVDQVMPFVEPSQQFVKDSIRLLKRCIKPHRKKIAMATAIRFAIMGLLWGTYLYSC